MWVVVRPEAMRVLPASAATNGGLPGTVIDLAFRGSGFSCRVAVDGLADAVKAELPIDQRTMDVGDAVICTWSAGAARILPRDSSA